MRSQALIAACAAAIVAGCAGTDAVTGAGCSTGVAAPIDQQTLQRAFDAEGITLHREDGCRAGAPGTFSNLKGSYGDDHDTITASEGHIICDLYAPSSDESTRIERFVWRNDPTPTHVDVLNVSCDLYPETTAHVDAVEDALRRLPGVSDLPATVPSEDADPA